MIGCTFAGHRHILRSGIEPIVEKIIEEILCEGQEFCFYTGGMGEFDALCARCVRRARSMHPEKKIRLVLVEPYMKQSINEAGKILLSLYDEIILPDELAGVHYKQAITKRNRWMIEHSDHLIAYVHRSEGGAYSMLRYAESKGMRIHHTVQK